MSVKAMAWVWDQQLPRDEKFILLAYADHADHSGGNIFPSIRLIANKTGYSERSVQRITRVLEANGLLIPEGGQNGGRNISAHWRMPIEKGDNIAPISLKGDKSDKRVTNEALKGDIAMSPEPLNNHHNNHQESGNSGELPLAPPVETSRKRGKAATKKKDPRLDHPALKFYRGIMHLNVTDQYRDGVIEVVGDSPSALESWRQLLLEWLGRGWNKANIAGILEAYKSGGIAKRTGKFSSRINPVRVYPEDEDAEFVRLNPNIEF